MIGYLNGIKIEINKKSHLSLEYLCDIEDKLNEKRREYNTKSLSKRKNSSPPVLKNQNIPLNEKVNISNILNRKASLQPNYQNQYSSNIQSTHTSEEIQLLIIKLEKYVKDYPFCQSVESIKEQIDKIKKVPLNVNEYDNQYKKLSKSVEKYEVYNLKYFIL